MLQTVTSHCPQGHALEESDYKNRTSKIKAKDVLDVRRVGWCDVCIEPTAPDELRFSCRICNYDVCWRCHDKGREAYIVSLAFTTGPLAGETVWGTMDVFKSRIDTVDLKENNSNDEVSALKAVTTFDCELFDLTFGTDKKEREMVEYTSEVIFSRSTGKMLRFNFSFINDEVDKDYTEYGASVEKLCVNKDFDNLPSDLANGNWFGVSASTSEDAATTTAYGTVGFRRFSR